ncbi:MAG: hypothetical protein C0623_03920 [Desulfuromonas sp.]|nr:MAG: hypothetical protein C0623_03920 [Desulfuromonas sp.]
MVRNPMYLSRYFIILGIFLLVGVPGVWAAIPYTVIYGFYMVNRVEREEKKLIDLFGKDYEDYYNSVPRFIPSFKGFDLQAVLFWNWETFHENHGAMNMIGLLVVYAIFYLFTFMI